MDANLTGAERPERVVLMVASPTYFEVLRATAELGRVLGPEDAAAGFAEAVVLSHAAWLRLFGGDPGAIGRQLRLDTDIYTVVGVMPAAFQHPQPPTAPSVDVWSTAGFTANPFPSPPQRKVRMLPGAIARLKPGMSLAQAQASLDTITVALMREFPGDYAESALWTVRVRPLRDIVVGNVRPILVALSGAVFLILVIGCANVTNLLLVRSSTRQREMAIRVAIGAGQGRLVKQLVVEHLMLAGVGGTLGMLTAFAAQSWLTAVLPAELPRFDTGGISPTVMLFGAAVTILTSLAIGIAPALQVSRTRPARAMLEGSRGSTPSRRQRTLQTTLVVAEIALALVLLVGAGLLLRTVSELLRVETGVASTDVLMARTWIAVPNNPEADRYGTPAARAALGREVLRRLHEIPGVASAALTNALPVSGMALRSPVQIEGRPSDDEAMTGEMVVITPGYFGTLQIPVLQGRPFTDADDTASRAVVVIDDAAARRWFPGQDALGKRLQIGRAGPRAAPAPAVIVGVVGDAKYDRLDEAPTPHVYVPMYQRSGRSISVVLKTTIAPDTIREQVRLAIEGADPDLPVFGVQLLDEKIAQSIARQRFTALALTAFSILALALAAVGVYGVMAFAIETRTQEIGVRMAMGATPRGVMTSVLRDAVQTAVIGVGVGFALAMLAVRSLRTMLYDVSPLDPGVFVGASALLVAVAVVASYLPARRASAVNPVTALRGQ